MGFRFAVDTGGTFTDLVVEGDDGELRIFKSPTTPGDVVEGVLAVLDLAAGEFGMSRADLLAAGKTLVHGTTVATNALVMGKQAKTAFVTTKGHPDILVLREAGRIGLPLFDYTIEFPEPFVPRSLTFELAERVAYDGSIIEPLRDQALDELVAKLREAKPEAVAVCLLWSVANPVHEQRVGERLRAGLPGVFVSLSHEVNPTIREYRRASATAIDASLRPIMWSYLDRLENALAGAGFNGQLFVVTSQGAMKSARQVAERPIHTVKSGPAMAPVAGRYFAAEDCAADTAIIADTGGTTYDVALVRRGQIPESRETWIGRPYLGHMTGFPSVDIRSVGAGGGSIGWVNEGGLLHVGPVSAGSEPGPACYGRGGIRPTITDAVLALGYIDPNNFLGGRLTLDRDKAIAAIERDVAHPLNLDVEAASLAMLRLLTETMAGAIADITVNQGIDPRGSVLVGGGGAAGYNSVAIARRLGCASVLFPSLGAALSAAGGLICPIRDSFVEFFPASSRHFPFEQAQGVRRRLDAQCHAFASASSEADGRIEHFTEARYAGQIWEIKLPVEADDLASQAGLENLIERFHRLHGELFAITDPGAEIEFVSWRADISIESRSGTVGLLRPGRAAVASTTHRLIRTGEGKESVPVIVMSNLVPGETRKGPAIIETELTTIVVDSFATFCTTPHRGVQVNIENAL